MAEPEAALGPHAGLAYDEFMSQLSRARVTARYLEIGVQFGLLFQTIQADIAVGVDPNFTIAANIAQGKRRVVLHQMSSDAFFADADAVATLGGPPDLVFLDGMHHFEFLLRDILHTEAIAAPDTLIVMHDCLPRNAAMADRDMEQAIANSGGTRYFGYWTGDVWKVVPILRKYRPDLRIVYLDCPPTGLVCITGLDPTSRVLPDAQSAIVAEAAAVPNDWACISEMYAEIDVTSSQEAVAAGLDRFCR